MSTSDVIAARMLPRPVCALRRPAMKLVASLLRAAAATAVLALLPAAWAYQGRVAGTGFVDPVFVTAPKGDARVF
eukprot:gene53964-72114_t